MENIMESALRTAKRNVITGLRQDIARIIHEMEQRPERSGRYWKYLVDQKSFLESLISEYESI